MDRQKPETIVWRPLGLPGVELQRGVSTRGDVPRHWHEDYRLFAVTAGYGELWFRGNTYATVPGTLTIVAPGDVHAYATPRPGGCDFLTLDFDPSFLDRGALPTAVLDDAGVFQRFLRLHRLLSATAAGPVRQPAVFEFLSFLTQRQGGRDLPKHAGAEPRAVRIVREYLTENYSKKIGLAQLTSLTGLSPFHLTRVFARETGLPPHAFLSQVRISRARELLRGRAPISLVAAETGFADQSHLSRAFKNIVGVSPGAYRQASSAASLGADAFRTGRILQQPPALFP